MTLHIAAEPEEIAETVLMPGDPQRAEWAAKTFLTDPQMVSDRRSMLAYTGHWQGHRVTFHGSGMGMPSLSIYATELMRDYGVRTVLRIGSTGAMQPFVALGDVILAMTASSISTPSASVFRELRYAPCADFNLLRGAADSATAIGARFHVGGIYSSDTFYAERDDLDTEMTRHGVLSVEMETAELYTLAARFGARALAVLTVSDHLQTGAALDPETRRSGFADMVAIALGAAFPGADRTPQAK